MVQKNKFIMLVTLVTLSLGGTSYAEIVKSLSVVGNTRLDSESVINYLPFKVGDNPNLQQIDAGVKALLSADLFSNAQITSDNQGHYKVEVAENPIVAKIYFEGNDRYDDKALQSEVLLKEGAMLTETRIKSSLLRLQELYKRSGRYATEITPKIIKKEDNRVDFIFEISEGEVVYIDDISFAGNREFSDSALRKVIDSQEDSWWKIFSSTSTFDEDRLALDKSKLAEFYETKGFVDFNVDSAVAELSADKKSFILKFVVSEGKRYTIKNVTINDSLTKISQEEIKDYIDQDAGDYYNKKSVRKNEEDLVLFLSSQGYPFVDVRGEIKRLDADTLDLNYVISQGNPVYVDRIDVTGNARTLDEIIRRKMSIVEGDALNRSLLEKSERDLRGTGYFSKVDMIERPSDQQGAVNMRVDVEEQSTGDVTFGVGYSTVDSVLGEASLSERNFLGRGQYVRLGALASGRRKEFNFSFTEPYMFGRELEGGFDLFHTTNDYSREASYNERNTGMVLRTGFLAAEDFTVRPRYKINYDEITNINSDASPIVQDSANRGGLVASSVGYEGIYDKRDDFIIPTEGYLLKINQDVAGVGGDVQAFKTVASGTVYYTPIEQFTLSYQLEGGAVMPFGGYKLRIIDRNLLGGTSFRGFQVGGIGPRFIPAAGQNVNDDAVGGSYFTVLRSELAVPLPGLDDFGMSGALFNDTGTLWHVDNVPNLNSKGTIKDTQAIRSSVGAGVKWNSPMGPIRLDFAYPVKKEKYDRTEVFRFSAGSQF